MAINRNRVEWLDAEKGILILLVVLGHVVGSAANATTGNESQICRLIFKAIYLFHMPAFFLLAGLTFRRFDFVGKFKRLLVPYFMFGILSIVIYQIAMRGMAVVWWHPWVSLIYGATFPGTDGFRCNSVLWFLPCLFMAMGLFSCIENLLSKLRYQRICEVTIGVLCVFGFVALKKSGCPELPFGLGRFLEFFPYVMTGHLLESILLKSVKDFSRKWLALLWIALFLYVISIPFVSADWSMYFSYQKWVACVILGFLGVLGSCALATCVVWRPVRMVGTLSIGIMMTHKWFVLTMNHVGVYHPFVVFPVAVATSVGMTLLIRKFAPWMLGEFAK